MTASGFTDQGTYTPDNLIAGEFPRADGKLTVPSGAGTVVRGQLLQSTGAKATTAANTYAVAAMDADATSADAEVTVYMTGEFNRAAVVGFTPSDADVLTLEAKNIYLKTIVGY